MRTTKYGTASALLIATLAVALVPTAAADGVQDCSQYADNVTGENPEEPTPQQCADDVQSMCADDHLFIPEPKPELYALCLIDA